MAEGQPQQPLACRSTGRQLWVGDQPLRLKGASWFGFETPDACVHGLWSQPLSFFMDFLTTNSFNCIRIPFSLDLALNDSQPKTVDYGKNEGLQGKSSLQVLDEVIAEAGKRGLLIMLDLHHLAADKGIIPLWYSDQYSEEEVIHGLKAMAQRYANTWNVFAMDITNEPHDPATWGTGDATVDWRAAAERLGNAVLEVAPRMLIFVEGVQTAQQPVAESTWWGGHLGDVQQYPLTLAVPERLVYAPHVYGPSVHAQPVFGEAGFPDNMTEVWQRQWGYLAAKSEGAEGPCVVVGEWGGRMEPGTPDETWHKAFGTYLTQQGLDVGFYWCLNPNSGDTGGLLQDDWTTPVAHKLELLATITPEPTKLMANA